ncbi:MAG: diacylglycerol kinase family protein [Thermoanaerobaculia bacterium]
MTATPRAFVLINRSAGLGRAPRRYERVRAALAARFALDEAEMDRAGAWQGDLDGALRSGIRVFLAAGGDGTVNAVASALFARRQRIPLSRVTLGAVGLGSSNDFHKPFGTVLGGIPLRIDMERGAPRDLVRASCEDAHGLVTERVFLVSASMGVAAAANALFNAPGRIGRAVQRRSVHLAVLFAGIRAIFRHDGIAAVLRTPESIETIEISNLSISKTPHLAAGLRFEGAIAADSGLLAVNLCHGMSRWRLLATLARLSRGRFLGRPGTRHWKTARMGVETREPAVVELDGEICLARKVLFEVIPERMSVCA